MSMIKERLGAVDVGAAQSVHNLTVFSLLGSATGVDYVTLEEALRRETVTIDETSEAGSVPELKLVNAGQQPVLLVDGEELVGAKQNRILNLTILVAAKTTTVIPVSCVEAGRWSRRSAKFGSADRAYYATGRAEKADQVTRSLRERGDRRSDQGAIWRGISAKMERLNAESNTGAMSDLYEHGAARIDAYVSAIRAEEGQAGAVFAIDGEVAGLELFDRESTLRALLPKLVRSYALDAIDRPSGSASAAASPDAARSFVEEVGRATVERFAATAEGEDLRLTGERLSGAALVVGGCVVHLSAFRR